MSVPTYPSSPLCPTCKGEGRILTMWERGPRSPPGNGYVGCPHCPAGREYDKRLAAELAGHLVQTTSNSAAWAYAALATCRGCGKQFIFQFRDRQRVPEYCLVCQPDA